MLQWGGNISIDIGRYNANQKQPGAVKKGTAKQSRIKNIVWYLRWLVRTRADINLRPKWIGKNIQGLMQE